MLGTVKLNHELSNVFPDLLSSLCLPDFEVWVCDCLEGKALISGRIYSRIHFGVNQTTQCLIFKPAMQSNETSQSSPHPETGKE